MIFAQDLVVVRGGCTRVRLIALSGYASTWTYEPMRVDAARSALRDRAVVRRDAGKGLRLAWRL